MLDRRNFLGFLTFLPFANRFSGVIQKKQNDFPAGTRIVERYSDQTVLWTYNGKNWVKQ